jgi:NitT/TauT family transport system permease protein
MSALSPPIRPEYERRLGPFVQSDVLPTYPWRTRLWRQGWLRKTVILVVLAILWELLARWQDNDLLLPTFSATVRALIEGLRRGELIERTRLSLQVLLQGYIAGIVLAFALNTYAGFEAVPDTLRMAGRNYGLTGIRYVLQILIPAALPSILSSLKIGWAFAWRTLIAAELVFGAASRQGGLGWYIFQNRNELYTERVTIRRWGVQR